MCRHKLCVDQDATCQADSDCANGACENGICTGPCSICSQDADCAGNLECVQHLCVSLSATCVDNRCRMTCEDATDCLAGEDCVRGTCEPTLCHTKLSGEQLCRVNNMWKAQQSCLTVPCADSNVDGRIGRILPENMGELQFGFVPNDPEDIDTNY